MLISLRSDFERFERALTKVQREQLPFATARALTDVAQAARQAVTAALPSIFDRPTSFTVNAIGFTPASKQSLTAMVFVRDIQANYLLHEEIGGIRTPTENTRTAAQAIVLPSISLRLDAYGNIPAGQLARLRKQIEQLTQRRKDIAVARKHVATGRPLKGMKRDAGIVYLKAGGPRGVGGYFKRLSGHHLVRLTGFAADTHYKPIFHYHDRVRLVAAQTFGPAMMRRLREALASAR